MYHSELTQFLLLQLAEARRDMQSLTDPTGVRAGRAARPLTPPGPGIRHGLGELVIRLGRAVEGREPAAAGA
jgi:hypothetical protein